MTERLAAAMRRLPLVAILRGVRPEEAPDLGAALVASGFAIIEAPLNSPDPLASIGGLRRSVPADVLVGAGTVTRPEEVRAVKAAGGELIVMPHCDPEVIAAAKSEGMIAMPGVATPSEAFAALRAGADALKLFPAELIAPSVVKAMLAVLPPGTAVLPVGGITPGAMAAYRQAGATGFGLGSALYQPGMTAQEVAARARRFAESWAALTPRG